MFAKKLILSALLVMFTTSLMANGEKLKCSIFILNEELLVSYVNLTTGKALIGYEGDEEKDCTDDYKLRKQTSSFSESVRFAAKRPMAYPGSMEFDINLKTNKLVGKYDVEGLKTKIEGFCEPIL